MSFELELKQKYLRQNILEKEYDAQQFMDFCQNLKGTVDIQSWTLKQLQNIVKSFIKQQNNKKQVDPFQSYQSAQSPRKIQAFDNWSQFVQPVQQQQQSFGLNLIDIDFLQSFGMGSSKPIPIKTQLPLTNKKPLTIQKPSPAQVQQKTVIQKPIVKPNPNQDLMKMMQNPNFISAYSSDPFFQIQKPQSISQQVNNSFKPKQPILIQSIPSSIPISIPSINSIKTQQKNIQSFVQQVKCRQIVQNKLNGGLICTVTGHQIVNPNVFVPKFVLYSINTAPNNITVQRRMKDFQQLRSLLKKMFPTTQVPHLQRYSRLSQTENHVVIKQKMYIQSFLNSLIINPLLRCKILEDFLFCTDLNKIKQILRQYQRMEKPRALEDLFTINGKLKLDTNMANRKYINQQQLYIDYVENSFGKLKTLYDQLTIYYQNTSKIISEIAQVYDQLKQTTHNVNQSFAQQLKINQIQPVLSSICSMHKSLSQSYQLQSKILQSQLRHPLKYQILNISTLRQTLKILTNLYQSYEKRTDKQLARRQVYISKKLSQYKYSAEISSKHVTVAKYQAAYAQNQIKQEIQRYAVELARKLANRFQIFTTLQVSVAADMDLVWRDFQKTIQAK